MKCKTFSVSTFAAQRFRADFQMSPHEKIAYIYVQGMLHMIWLGITRVQWRTRVVWGPGEKNNAFILESGHFTMFWPLEGHPRGHCIMFHLQEETFTALFFQTWRHRMGDWGNQTHWGIFGKVPLRDGYMVVEHFAGDPLLGLGFPQYGVKIGEVMVDVYSVIAPPTQRPAAELWTLGKKEIGSY